MPGLQDRLREKGWTSAEIEHAMHHMNIAEQKKHPFVKFTEKSIYGLLVFAIILTIVAFGRFVFPFLNLLPKSASYTTVAILGAVTSMFYSHVINDLEHASTQHHVFAIIAAIAAAISSAWLYADHAIFLAVLFSGTFTVQYLYAWWKR